MKTEKAMSLEREHEAMIAQMNAEIQACLKWGHLKKAEDLIHSRYLKERYYDLYLEVLS